ncbi:MAG: DUF4339 domain-containing protein [Planctomycetaceae bacterium]
MGIVAYCPQGHRVKVKDELAGRKGICPECQARFRIPRADGTMATRSGRRATECKVARVVSLDPAVAAALPRALAIAPTAEASVAAAVEPPDAERPAAPLPLHPALAERPELNWSMAVPGGEASAPMSATALQSLLEAGGLTGAELVWREGWSDWVSIRLVFPECLFTNG